MRFLFFIHLFLLMVSSPQTGCNTKEADLPVSDSSSIKSFRYLALGDSYTIGQGVREEERFPAQTSSLLIGENIPIESTSYIAATGWPTTELLRVIDLEKPQGPFDLVSLLIGVNDQYQGKDISDYHRDFIFCITKAIELSGYKRDRVFVLSIPDYSVTPFAYNFSDTTAIRQELEQFNEINKRVTDSLGISYTSITALTQQARFDKTLLASDSLHPSGKDYQRWAALLAPKMKEALGYK